MLRINLKAERFYVKFLRAFTYSRRGYASESSSNAACILSLVVFGAELHQQNPTGAYLEEAYTAVRTVVGADISYPGALELREKISGMRKPKPQR